MLIYYPSSVCHVETYFGMLLKYYTICIVNNSCKKESIIIICFIDSNVQKQLQYYWQCNAFLHASSFSCQFFRSRKTRIIQTPTTWLFIKITITLLIKLLIIEFVIELTHKLQCIYREMVITYIVICLFFFIVCSFFHPQQI